MDYGRIEENKLIALARTDDRATEYLLDKYRGLVISLARKFYLDGGDIEDLISEGMIGLYKAVLSFDELKDASFITYAHLLISRQMINAVKKGSALEKKALHSSLPISEAEGEYSSDDPFERLLEKDEWEEYVERLGKLLSSLEYKAMMLYLSGENYRDIATKLSKEVKAIDNAISRAKKKIAKDLK